MTLPIAWRPAWWLALAMASFAAALATWQDQRLDRIRPPAIGQPAPSAPAAESSLPAASPIEPAQTATAPAAASITTGGSVADPAPAADAPVQPGAGRVVLRCVVRGQVTYKDLNAGCPEGAAQRVTVFPTEGVGKPK